VTWVVSCGLCVVLSGLHKVLFDCLCCCWGGVHRPPRGASVDCCRRGWWPLESFWIFAPSNLNDHSRSYLATFA